VGEHFPCFHTKVSGKETKLSAKLPHTRSPSVSEGSVGGQESRQLTWPRTFGPVTVPSHTTDAIRPDDKRNACTLFPPSSEENYCTSAEEGNPTECSFCMHLARG